MQVTQLLPKRDASTADKSINQDDAQCMVKDVTTVARSATLRQFAEGIGPVQSMWLRKEPFISKNLALKW